MTSLEARDIRPRSLTRADEAALFVGRLAERASPGERLGTKEELRERSGVSKGTFNEALRILQTRSLISVRPGPGGGIFAARPTPLARLGSSFLALDGSTADVADAIVVRDQLERIIVSEALLHATTADIQRMRDAVDDMAAAVEADDPTGFVRANWDLHAAMARTTPNTLLRSIYSGLLDVVSAHTTEVVPDPDVSLQEYIRTRLDLHRDLVNAVESRDRAEALRLIELHTLPSGG